jgi:hypothetical protein
MDRDVTHKILYGPKRSWDPYTILRVTDRSTNCHLARSAMNYLLYYTQYMQICQTTCFVILYLRQKNEFEQNPEENIILIGPGQYTKLSSFPPATCWLHKQNSYQSSRGMSWTYQQWAGVITKLSQHLNDNSCEDVKRK